MKYAWSVWPALAKKISGSKEKLLLLDFDGTLVKIVRKPHWVVLEKKTHRALTRLSRSKGYRLAFVSGRSLRSLTSYIRYKNAIYAGNHGLELKGRGLSLPAQARRAQKMRSLIRIAGRKLKAALSKVPGVMIEDKGYTLSLHYRAAAAKDLPRLKRELALFKKKFSRWPLEWRVGKKVWEVRPGLKWDKGDMALYLAGKFPKALPIIIWDDVTDEDMFKPLRRRSITIRVGKIKRSSAEYYLKSPGDVAGFLERICRL